MAGMFYSLREAAEKLNLNEDQLKEFVQEGKLREFRDGPNLLFKIDEVEALIPQVEEETAMELEIPEPEAEEGTAMELEAPEPEAPEAEIPEPEEAEEDISELQALSEEEVPSLEALAAEMADLEA